ncbi:MAG: type I glyceraldehyde-3-phosphate dehydrogenase [Bacteroidota bacterium]|nr:type I glyceraldehyde-3-phosphate dehydrogenase [Bacteroidota bacterium]
MKKRIAINGFGRIGRLTTRQLLKRSEIELVGINDLTDTKTLAHLFKYDTAHRTFAGDLGFDEKSISFNGHKISATSETEIKNLPWKDLGVDLVLECTGIFLSRDKTIDHINAGAKKVIISAPPKDHSVPTFVLGVNDHGITGDLDIISNASCTTNCLSVIIKVIHERFGIQFASMNTIHAYTQDQRLQDAPHKDLRRARAAAMNIVPTSTGAAKAVEVVYPEIKGRLIASSYRVPIITGSLIELVCILEKNVSVEEINQEFHSVSLNSLKNILAYNTDEIVSSDIIGSTYSAIFDAPLTEAKDNKIKVVAWYDNESGYSARLADMCVKFALS